MDKTALFVLSFILSAVLGAAEPKFPTMLYAAEGAKKILWFDATGRVAWDYPAEMSRDVWHLPNGNILFTCNNQYDPKKNDNPSGVMEVTPEKKVVFHFRTTGQVWACQRLADGATLVGAASQGKLLIVNARGKVTRTVALRARPGHSCIRQARALENGHFLVVEPADTMVREYGADGRMLREIRVPFAPFGVRRLSGGNTIVTGKTGIVELDPAGKAVWEFKAEEAPELGIRWLAGFEILPNGNLLVVNAGGKVPFFEVARHGAKKIVWSSAGLLDNVPFGHGISLTPQGPPAQ